MQHYQPRCCLADRAHHRAEQVRRRSPGGGWLALEEAPVVDAHGFVDSHGSAGRARLLLFEADSFLGSLLLLSAAPFLCTFSFNEYLTCPVIKQEGCWAANLRNLLLSATTNCRLCFGSGNLHRPRPPCSSVTPPPPPHPDIILGNVCAPPRLPSPTSAQADRSSAEATRTYAKHHLEGGQEHGP